MAHGLNTNFGHSETNAYDNVLASVYIHMEAQKMSSTGFGEEEIVSGKRIAEM
jgi:hypothetical protein